MAGEIDVKKLRASALKQGYLRRDADELDEAVNVLTDGPIDDTISSRMQRWKDGTVPHPNRAKKAAGRLMCWLLGLIQKGHDIKANVGDLSRAQAEEERNRKTLEEHGVDPNQGDIG